MTFSISRLNQLFWDQPEAKDQLKARASHPLTRLSATNEYNRQIHKRRINQQKKIPIHPQ
jgi:hypothetical protein